MKQTLTITIERDWANGLRRDAVQAFQGKRVGNVLSFSEPELFFSKLTANRWALVRSLQGAGALGVREAARRVGRDVRRVHDDLQVLVELGLLEKTDDGKVWCPFDDIHVDMHVRAA
jgi:predicted transcriptional regulator